MGQFLTTGIAYRFRLSKSDIDLVGRNEDDALLEVQHKLFGTEKALFDSVATDDGYIFNIKEEILNEELIPFLSEFYQDFYGNKNKECQLVLDNLKKLNSPDKWESILEEETFECFQIDNYAYRYFEINGSRTTINCKIVMLSLEGKIMMESYGQHFSFFEAAIAKAYAKFELSNLVRVYITG